MRTSESYGVVYCGDSGIICATCRYDRFHCVHVRYITDHVRNDNIPETLEQFASQLNLEAKKPTKEQSSSLQSSKKIPFELPSEMAGVLKQPFSQRFKMDEGGVCHLRDDDSLCSQCGFSAWYENGSSADTVIITRNQLFPAKGISQLIFK